MSLSLINAMLNLLNALTLLRSERCMNLLLDSSLRSLRNLSNDLQYTKRDLSQKLKNINHYSLRKLPKFYLISWFEVFMETHYFPKICSQSPETQ